MTRQIVYTLAFAALAGLAPWSLQANTEDPAPGEGTPAPEGAAPPAAAAAPRAVKDCPPGIGCVTRRPLPRYVSLKGAEARARRGPAADHRVDWIYQRQGLPLKVTAEYENWRRVEDHEGAGGWIHFALLSNNRSVMIAAEMADLYNSADGHGQVVARAQAGAVARLLECQPDWCRVSQDGIRGWVKKTDIWGVEPGEVFE